MLLLCHETGDDYRSVWCGYANFGYPTTPTVALVICTSATVIAACSHRRHGEDKTVCLILSVSVVWTQLATRQDRFVLKQSKKQSKEAFYESTGCSLYAIKLSNIPVASMSWDLIQFRWALSRLDPVSNLHLFSVKYIEDCGKLGNWQLGPYKSKLSCLVCSCVHTVDADKTVLSCPRPRSEQAMTNAEPVSLYPYPRVYTINVKTLLILFVCPVQCNSTDIDAFVSWLRVTTCMMSVPTLLLNVGLRCMIWNYEWTEDMYTLIQYSQQRLITLTRNFTHSSNHHTRVPKR